jgi:PAS domain S-box-containing protein
MNLDIPVKEIPTASGTTSQMVLIVDDDQNIVNVLEQALQYKGYTIRCSTDSKEALRIFEEEGEFDVVITDLMMPGLSGTELLKSIKEVDANCEVIVLTGFGSSDTAIEALKVGAYDYIKKPANLEELYISVQKAIEKRRLTLQNIDYQMDLERLVAERTSELAKTQKFLHSVLESSTEYFIIATDADGMITLFNSGAERLFGYDRSEVEQKKTVLFLSGLEGAGGRDNLKDFLKDGMVDEAQEIVNRDGKEISISLTVTPIQGDEMHTTGYIWIGRDITDRLALEAKLKEYTETLEKKVEERTLELKQQNEALEKTLKQLKETQVQLLQADKMASLGQLAAGVAHEINNPIGFINSNLNTLKKYMSSIQDYGQAVDKVLTDDSPSAINDLNQIRRAKKVDFIIEDISAVVNESLEGTERVKTIVQDLKDFSYQGREGFLPYDLNKGIKSTLNIVQNELKNKVEVIEELGDIPTLQCYPQQVNQVFMNLLVNAAQAIPKRGKIIIRTYLDKDEAIAEFIDNGIGISAENLQKIFEPFYTTKEVGEGTGLGLSISYRIIEKHRGCIEVESEKGKGTTFRVRLPLNRQEQETDSELTQTVEAV